MTLLVLNRLDIQGQEKEIIINTRDILSIEPDGEEAIVTTSKCSFPITIELYETLKQTKSVKHLIRKE